MMSNPPYVISYQFRLVSVNLYSTIYNLKCKPVKKSQKAFSRQLNFTHQNDWIYLCMCKFTFIWNHKAMSFSNRQRESTPFQILNKPEHFINYSCTVRFDIYL